MDDARAATADVGIGQPVYDESGRELGEVRGFDEDGIYVSVRDGIEGLSVEHVHAGGPLGEAELTWRCWECGAMGDIEDLPDGCPDCGAPREDIYYSTED